MPNVYADLATLKSASVLNAPDNSHDARLLDLLEAASRWIDGYCDRRSACCTPPASLTGVAAIP